MEFYLYILYSLKTNIFYVGYTSDFDQRIHDHNNSEKNTFTSKHRPWKIKALFKVNGNESDAMKIERFIKKQKSRKLLEILIQDTFIPDGKLAQLVRVPYVRD